MKTIETLTTENVSNLLNWAMYNPDKFADTCKSVPVGDLLVPTLWRAYINDSHWWGSNQNKENRANAQKTRHDQIRRNALSGFSG